MKIKVIREILTPTETLGSLFINDKFFCYTLEDVDRKLKSTDAEEFVRAHKVKANTAIPSGEYRMILSMSNRFKRIMPEVLNVKGFQGIRFHGGNTHHDSEGCILVAKQRNVNKPSSWQGIKNWVFGSQEKQLVAEMQKALGKGEKIDLSIVY